MHAKYCTSWWSTIRNNAPPDCFANWRHQRVVASSYDVGVTRVSRVIISTLHWSVLTVYFKRKPPASVYAVRIEQGFRTPGVFSCNAFSFRSCLHLQTQFGEDRCTQFRDIVVTDTARPPATNTQTHRQDRLQYTVPLYRLRNLIVLNYRES